MKTSNFDFDLSFELIAQAPPQARDAARMLVVGGDAGLYDDAVRNFIKYLRPGDAVVFNDSRVIPCRFDAGGYEFTLHTKTESGWWGFAKKSGKLKIGDRLRLADGTEIKITDKSIGSGLHVEFDCDNVFEVLERTGKMPLPPYIRRMADETDAARYQTVYAGPLGSMAAPTAGLHFTPELLATIKAAGAEIINITLHVGAGTWLPVKAENIRDHKMHGEYGVITPQQAEAIGRAKRVIAVGTTSLRLLENAAGKPFAGTTDIFITPGYKFKVVDVLLTNFHLPRSTLFMLVCAFAGMNEMRRAYAHAISEKYRFFSYGDCCLLFKKDS